MTSAVRSLLALKAQGLIVLGLPIICQPYGRVGIGSDTGYTAYEYAARGDALFVYSASSLPANLMCLHTQLDHDVSQLL